MAFSGIRFLRNPVKTFFIIALFMTLMGSGPVDAALRQSADLESDLLDRYMEQTHQGNWQRIDPHIPSVQRDRGQRSMHTGTTILSNGIYMQFDRQGNPKDLLLAQAHFVDPGSRSIQRPKGLGRASRSSLLAMIAQYYAEASDDFRSGMFSRSSSPPSVAKRAVTLPVKSSQTLYLWFDFKEKKWKFYSRAGVTGSLIMRRLYSLSIYLEKAAARIIPYRSEIFYFKATGKDTIQVTAFDSDTGGKLGDPHLMRMGKLSERIQSITHKRTGKSIDSGPLKRHKEEDKNKEAEKARIKIVTPLKRSDKKSRMSIPFTLMSPNFQQPPIIGFSLAARADDHTTAHGGTKSANSHAIERYRVKMGESRKTAAAASFKSCCLPERLFNPQFASATINETNPSNFSLPVIKNMSMRMPIRSTQTTTQMVEGRLGPIRSSRMLSYGTISPDYINLDSNGEAFRDGQVAAVLGVGVGMGVGAIGMTVGTAGAGTAISTLTGLVGGAAVLTGGVLVAAIAAGATFQYLFNLQDAKTNQKRVEYLLESVQKSLSENALKR